MLFGAEVTVGCKVNTKQINKVGAEFIILKC